MQCVYFCSVMLFDSILSSKISENTILMVYYEIRHLNVLRLWQLSLRRRCRSTDRQRATPTWIRKSWETRALRTAQTTRYWMATSSFQDGDTKRGVFTTSRRRSGRKVRHRQATSELTRLYNDSILQYYRRAGLRRCDVDIERFRKVRWVFPLILG